MVVALTRQGWPDGNLILSVVPPEERRRLLPHLEAVELRSREVLFAAIVGHEGDAFSCRQIFDMCHVFLVMSNDKPFFSFENDL